MLPSIPSLFLSLIAFAYLSPGYPLLTTGTDNTGTQFTLQCVQVTDSSTVPTPEEVPTSMVEYYDPTVGGGSMLDNAGNGLGEPLNVIISGLSSQAVLRGNGILNFAKAIGFSQECFGIHLGNPQSANLGDGNGWVNQTVELRQDYGDSDVGTCLETLIGGNHFRVFRQNGTLADSGALFLAVSEEEDLAEGHTIVPDGYNIGRDKLVSNAVGTHEFDGVRYTTTARNITGLMQAGSVGVNHGIATDGIVTVLTISVEKVSS